MASSSTTSGRPESEPANTSTTEYSVPAFHEIALSASTSGTSSTLIQKPSFDVFINHRGPDVKKTLATRIYNLLDNMKVTAFLDSEELELGDFLPTTLEAAIRGATLHIAIFSETYAESAWCLEELSLMLKSGAKIIPIFYNVEPNDIRYVAQKKGKYADAFERHKKKRRCRPEKLQEWADALYRVSLNSGEIIKNIDDELRLYQKIVNIVLKEISNVPLLVAKHPVGLNETVEDFENTLQLPRDDQGVQIVGIWGMGGSGKTTLAKEMYNKRSSSMGRSCFIFDIREAKGVLQNKQNQLLKSLGVKESVDTIEQGKAILAKHLRSFKMLIVMDDVDHVDQFDALLPTKDHLAKDSLIIVTTREREVLRGCGIFSVYKMKALNSFQAERLFCWHAFLRSSPLNGFEELVKKFVEACNGLPLSLMVFGGQLYGQLEKQYWESMFHKISRILPDDVKEKLKVSYDALDNEEKEAFLDTACFFIGEKKSLAIEVWDGSEWSGLYTLKKLQNKCLVEVDNQNCIRMHDHLRDLGREIASQHSPSRLWSSQQIINYDIQTEKRNVIRGIRAAPTGTEERSYREKLLQIIRSSVGLKLLEIRGACFNQVSSEISRELLWLRCFKIDQRNLPARLPLTKLRVLELSENITLRRILKELKLLVPSEGASEEEAEEAEGASEEEAEEAEEVSEEETEEAEGASVEEAEEAEEDSEEEAEEAEVALEELWVTKRDAPVQLRELDVSNCEEFQRLPNSIGRLNQLKKIVIKGSANISSLPEEFCHLQMLEHLELEHCFMLSSLPSNFGDLKNLRYLKLGSCRKLRSLPVSFKSLVRLRYLNLEGCGELILTSDSFQNITMLEFLSLSECDQLEELPRDIINQASLRELYLRNVNRLRELPIQIGKLSRLRKMIIQNGLLISLPNSFGNLSSLTDLAIYRCSNLESLPTSFGDLFSLMHLLIGSCPKLKCLPFSVGCLNVLEDLKIFKCPINQVDFGVFAFSNLKSLVIEQTEVCRISMFEDRYPLLERLKLVYNKHLTEIEALPANLEYLQISFAPKLDKLPSFARLTSLKKIQVTHCDRIEKIEGFQDCTRLEELDLRTRWDVPGIESLEKMEKLRSVELHVNKGSAIGSCIQTIQKWPDELIIRMKEVTPNASSLVDSFKLGLSPDLLVGDSSDKNISSNGNASMFCFVGDPSSRFSIHRDAWIVLCAQRPENGYSDRIGGEKKLEVRGEVQRVVVEVLLPLLQIISG